MAVDQFGNPIQPRSVNQPLIAAGNAPIAGNPRGYNINDPAGYPAGYAADQRGVYDHRAPNANFGLNSTIITAVADIDKAMGELSAASTAQVISPVGALTSTAHVISPGALKAADDKVRAATLRLKDAVGAANGRTAGDPNWHSAVQYPAGGPNVAAQPVAPRAPLFGKPAAAGPTPSAAALAANPWLRK